jgi:hypothetical protein
VESNRAAARTARFSPASAVLPRKSAQLDSSGSGSSSLGGFSLMPVQGAPPSSRRPSGFPPSASWLNGSDKLPPSVGGPSSADEAVFSESMEKPFSGNYSLLPRSGVRSHGADELSGPASARENFKRAAEIGAQARRDAGLDDEVRPKKTKDP